MIKITTPENEDVQDTISEAVENTAIADEHGTPLSAIQRREIADEILALFDRRGLAVVLVEVGS